MKTNLAKMNELVGAHADKAQIEQWAYMNRICVMSLADEEEFATMSHSINCFIENADYHGMDDEHKAWSLFLDAEYVEEESQ